MGVIIMGDDVVAVTYVSAACMMVYIHAQVVSAQQPAEVRKLECCG